MASAIRRVPALYRIIPNIRVIWPESLVAAGARRGDSIRSFGQTGKDHLMSTTKNKPSLLITGATGQVGKAVIQHLSSDTSVEVVAAARSPEKAKSLGVPVVELDLDRTETLAPALQGIDRAFLVTGYTVDMLRQSKAFLDAAKKAGVKHVVHLGACGDDETTVAHWGWHQFVERYIEWSGFSFTHLRPETFMQNLLGYGGTRAIVHGVIRHFVGGARLSWVDCEDVAAVAAACLRDAVTHKGRTYRLGYDAKSYQEVADILTQVVGLPFSYNPRPPEEFLTGVLASGADPAYMQCVYEHHIAYAAGKIPGADHVFDNFEPITGKKATTWRDFAGKHAAEFRYDVS
jgi:NAD(P)H dehydrogenase (quinone)